MPSALSRHSRLEAALERQLRERIHSEIALRALTPGEIARALGILPAAAAAMLKDEGSWGLEKTVRACEALGLEVEVR